MAATSLFAGDAAIITYNSDADSIVLLFRKAIGSGTRIFITDRAWNGTAFVAAPGDGTIELIVGPVDFAAGLAVRFIDAQLESGGIFLDVGGETLYVYQGSDADTPTSFLFAMDMGDGNETFDGSLLNTGLTEGVHTVAIGADNASFGTRLSNIQDAVLDLQLGNPTDWNRNDTSPQPTTPTFTFLTDPPESQLVVAGQGGGDAIVTVDIDDEPILGNDIATRILHALQADPASGEDHLYAPRDIAVDTVHGLFFFVDSDRNGHNRIVQGSIADLLANPGGPIDLTILYSNDGAGLDGIIHSLSIDTANGKIYFDENTTFNRIDYDVEGQTPTVLADLSTAHGAFSFTNQLTIDYATGTVYLASSYVDGAGTVESNRILVAAAGSADGLATAPADSLVFAPLLFLENDTSFGDPDVPSLGAEHWPQEKGAIAGIDVDPATGLIYFTTQTVFIDTSTAQDGSEITAFRGGVYRYDPANPASLTPLFLQDGVNGPTAFLSYIEVDPVTGQYFVTNRQGTDSGTGSIWTGSMATPGTPTLLAVISNDQALGPQGLEIQHAPTLAGSPDATSAAEDGPPIAPGAAFVADDEDSGGDPNGDELAGAQVRISDGFQPGDLLSVEGGAGGSFTSTDGDVIAWSYDQATGVLTLSGVGSFASYQEALAAVRYQSTGDNPTVYDDAPGRTISYSVFDGLLYSDEVANDITVVGVNDPPVNGVPASIDTVLEDSVDSPLAGLSVGDPDADPATDELVVTFAVGSGTLEIATNVTGGIVAGDITGGAQDSGTITITATQDQINATLAANGLTFTPPADFNGPVTLTMTSNDQGATGDEPSTGGTGDGTSEEDTDQVIINVQPVNDPPVVDLNGTDPGTSAASAYTEGQTLTIIAPAATLSDIDSPDFDGGTLVVEITGNAEEFDRLGIQDQGVGIGQITVGEGAVYYNFGHLDENSQPVGPEVIASFFGGADGVPLTFAFNANATPEAVQALIRAIGFYNIGASLTDADRTITWTLTDGDGGTGDPRTATIDVTVFDEPAVAEDDNFFTDENAALVGRDLFGPNGNGNDLDPDSSFEVTEVNGQAADVGTQITLPSGALLTVRADGTFDYDPNGQFDHLAWFGSGAANSSATETFTYTITGGDTATVTITIQGVASPGDRLEGDSGDNVITGTPLVDIFQLEQGGEDTVQGLASSDGFYFGAALSAGDQVDGGGGTNDQLIIQGDYSSLYTFGAGNMVNVEVLAILRGADTRFGDPGTNLYDYNLATVDANVGAGRRFIVDYSSLAIGEDVVFDGSAETDGAFNFYAGKGDDHLIGGAGADLFLFRSDGRFTADDRVDGGGGNDELALRGHYDGADAVFFNPDTMTNVEVLVLLSGQNTSFGRIEGLFSYDITLDDANVAAGQRLTVDAAQLTPNESLIFDGSAETDGFFRIFGGKCDDVLIGGAGNDTITGNQGADLLLGGDGNDVFAYRSVLDSNFDFTDGIFDFTSGEDKIDLSRIDANTLLAGNNAFTFIGDAAFSNTAGELRAEDDGAGAWLIQGDVDGDGLSDLEIIVLTCGCDPITSDDFFL